MAVYLALFFFFWIPLNFVFAPVNEWGQRAQVSSTSARTGEMQADRGEAGSQTRRVARGEESQDIGAGGQGGDKSARYLLISSTE